MSATRRQVFSRGLALGTAAATLPAAAASARRLHWVLVHGAWHGGWCWRKLVPLLEAQGHRVWTPTLTGLGERAHLLSADVDLQTHVLDVSALLEMEDLNNVVLVGHSYAGMVITGVADRLPERLMGLIYLDAFLPDAGKALRDYTPARAPAAPAASDVPPPVRDWRVPPRQTAKEFGIQDEAEAAWVQARLRPQSAKTFVQPLPLRDGFPHGIRRAYIRCTDDAWFIEAAQRAGRQGATVRELLGHGHDAMWTAPAALARLLSELSAA
ncbi:alpha/beta fold hydrolase [Inhella sp.]|uniref:alpha/beta fold hydrolase n=1 Tax=Inhella sp. TaxID=1921806 RepID=UPI0035B0A06F